MATGFAVRADVDVEDGDVREMLDALEEPLPEERIFDYLRERIRDQFLTEGSEFGGGWRRLRPGTVRQKESGSGILRQSGDLYRSFTERGHSRHVEERTEDGLVFGSSWPTAHLHQGGTPRMARRPILPEAGDVEIDLEKMVDEDLSVRTGSGLGLRRRR